MSNAELLSAEECAVELLLVPHWSMSEDGDSIARTIELQNYDAVVRLVNAIAALAIEHDQHPDVSFGYNSVGIVLQTHAVGGLTPKDFSLAVAIDQLPEIYGETDKAEDFLAG